MNSYHLSSFSNHLMLKFRNFGFLNFPLFLIRFSSHNLSSFTFVGVNLNESFLSFYYNDFRNFRFFNPYFGPSLSWYEKRNTSLLNTYKLWKEWHQAHITGTVVLNQWSTERSTGALRKDKSPILIRKLAWTKSNANEFPHAN